MTVLLLQCKQGSKTNFFLVKIRSFIAIRWYLKLNHFKTPDFNVNLAILE